MAYLVSQQDISMSHCVVFNCKTGVAHIIEYFGKYIYIF